MGLSDGLVIFICILIAGVVVAGGAAMYRIYSAHEFSNSVPAPSDQQQQYMRSVRTRKWPMLRVDERPPPSSYTSNTSAV
jgi:hypothetical protein